MEEKEILNVKNYNKISRVIPTNPQFVASDFSTKIEELFYGIKDIEHSIQQKRQEIRELESSLQDKKKIYQELSPLFTLEYETSEKEYSVQKSSLGIMGLGNDTLGRSSMV